jgi:protein-tyrosine phosphatase
VDITRSGIELIEWPLIDGRVDLSTPIGMAPLYGEIIERCGERIAGTVNLLGAPDARPALVLCSAGKDRTGLVVGLLLSAVGVSDEDVMRDYSKSERLLNAAFRTELAARGAAAGFTRQPAVTSGAPSVIMQ